MKKILTGPSSIRLVLDSEQIFPDDPGMGTPAMVEMGGFSGTYNCAINEGEIDFPSYQLTQAQINWLLGHEDLVWEFLARR